MFKKSIFRNSNFLLLWLGQLVSMVGNQLFGFATAWYIYDLTGSTLAMGASILTSFLPEALLTPVAGIAADRLNRKTLIVLCDTVSGLLILALYVLANQSGLTIPVILTFNVLLSIVSSFFNPSTAAATQSVLAREELRDANSLRQLKVRLSVIAGAFLAGWLLKAIGISFLLLLDGVSFLISAASECFIQLPKSTPSAKQERPSFIEDWKVALQFVWAHKALLFVLLFALVIANGLLVSLSLYLPGIFKDVLAQDSQAYGFYYGIEGTVAAVTSLFILGSRRKLDPMRAILTLLALEGLVLVGLGLVQHVTVAYLIAGVAGFAFAACSIMYGTVFQQLVPNEMMGRAAGFSGLLASASIPLFTLGFSVLGEQFPLQRIVLVAGLVFLALLLPAPRLLAKEQATQAA